MKTFETYPAHDAASPSEQEAARLTLAALPVGTQARVIAVDDSSAVARRLIEMGIVPGARVEIVGSAPLGDPLKIFVRGYYLALRRAEAQLIVVRAERIDAQRNGNL